MGRRGPYGVAISSTSFAVIQGEDPTGRVKHIDGASYDLATGSWTTIPANSGPLARRFRASVWSDGRGRVYYWGGVYQGNYIGDPDDDTYPRDGYVYEPSSRTWSRFIGGPTGRQHATAVWTGSDAILWGGENQPPEGNATLFTDGQIHRP